MKKVSPCCPEIFCKDCLACLEYQMADREHPMTFEEPNEIPSKFAHKEMGFYYVYDLDKPTQFRMEGKLVDMMKELDSLNIHPGQGELLERIGTFMEAFSL